MMQALARYSDHPVEAIVPVAHGAALAGIRDNTLAFDPPDYEWNLPPESLAAYRATRDPFALSGSPALPGGLNMGAQLHMLEASGALQGSLLMPYAQYWAWWLSGVAASEVTSLGCHSDLWDPSRADYSPMAKSRGWAGQFAPLARAGDWLGALKPDLVRHTGLSPSVRVYTGLHDSNAALLAARGCPELAGQETTVLSTGTWFVAMRSPGRAVDPAVLPEDRDCLVNVDTESRPVPSARYMGGRELELLGARIDRPGTHGFSEVLASGTMLLPSQVPGCGPFPNAPWRWLGEPADPVERRAAIALYAALMADVSLDLIGACERLLIEGRFARSELFVRALATLRPDTKVYTSSAQADVSFGALRLVLPDLKPHQKLETIKPLNGPLMGYRDRWREQI
ncbi:MAG: carbohydrate kinase [Novosphingobium sp.]